MKTTTKLIVEAYKERYRIAKEIDTKRLEKMALEHELSGLGHKGVELTEEQQKSDKPMPTKVSPTYDNQKKLSLIEQKDELEKEIMYLSLSLHQADKVKKLPLTDQQMMHDLFHSRKTAVRVAEDHGYAVGAMYRHIYGSLDRLA